MRWMNWGWRDLMEVPDYYLGVVAEMIREELDEAERAKLRAKRK